VRIVSRDPARRKEIEGAGAELVIGDPDRIGTLRDALASVTVACWLLATASGQADALVALHTDRLDAFVTRTIDSTVRGLVYEAGPGTGSEHDITTRPLYRSVALAHAGAEIVTRLAELNAIPLAVIRSDPRARPRWVSEAHGAVQGLLGG
jgi:hypothetical protein